MFRVPIMLLRKNDKFSEMSAKKVGHLGGLGGGHILKMGYTLDELPLINMQVLKTPLHMKYTRSPSVLHLT
jgi:hypothetical protein